MFWTGESRLVNACSDRRTVASRHFCLRWLIKLEDGDCVSIASIMLELLVNVATSTAPSFHDSTMKWLLTFCEFCLTIPDSFGETTQWYEACNQTRNHFAKLWIPQLLMDGGKRA